MPLLFVRHTLHSFSSELQMSTKLSSSMAVAARNRNGQNIISFSTRHDAFFLDRGDAQICMSAHILCRCEYSPQGDDGFLPYMVGSEKGPPKQQNKG